MTYVIQIITAFLGSLGFSMVFNSNKKHLFVQSMGGAVAWSVYLASVFFGASETIGYFVAAVVANLYAEVFARIKKTPATVVLISALIPLIPGASLYYTMRYGINEGWKSFFERGETTFSLALAIALGIILVSTLVKVVTAAKKAKK